MDALVVLGLAGVLYAGAVIARYDQVSVRPAASRPGDACNVLDQAYTSCVTIGSDVYVTAADAVAFPPQVLLAALVVYVLLQGLTGATPGKLLVGLRVVGPEGRPPGLLRALVRMLLLAVDGFPWVLPILGFLLAGTTKWHRRLGDLVAGTAVVRRRALARRS